MSILIGIQEGDTNDRLHFNALGKHRTMIPMLSVLFCKSALSLSLSNNCGRNHGRPKP